jgi:hypothetical protein
LRGVGAKSAIRELAVSAVDCSSTYKNIAVVICVVVVIECAIPKFSARNEDSTERTIVTIERTVREDSDSRGRNGTWGSFSGLVVARPCRVCVVSELAICKLTRCGAAAIVTTHSAAPTMVTFERRVHEGGRPRAENSTVPLEGCVVSELAIRKFSARNQDST